MVKKAKANHGDGATASRKRSRFASAPEVPSALCSVSDSALPAVVEELIESCVPHASDLDREEDSSTSPLSYSGIAEYLVSSESPPPLCGPHQDCCGGALNGTVYTPCIRRLGKPGEQHARKQVCLSKHIYFKCTLCSKVVHSGCWVPKADGTYTLPSASSTFQCYDCDGIQSASSQQLQLPSKCTQESNADLGDTCPSEQIAALAPTLDANGCQTVMSFSALMKHAKSNHWHVRSSSKKNGRMYFYCVTCSLTFKAKIYNDCDDLWLILGMPTQHSCCDLNPVKLETSLLTLKSNLSDAVCKEIERLGASGAFTSTAIQKHLLSTNSQLLVDTTLIKNIAYRAKQKLFGYKGDLINLLEQQKARRLLGDTYELVIAEGSLRLPCADLLKYFLTDQSTVPFFDYLLLDGSHGFSKHGWKYIPICVRTSGSFTVPICAVWALEEETASLLKLLEFLRGHLDAHGVDSSAFALRTSPEEPFVSEEHARSALRNFIYHPKWEAFLVASMDETTSNESILPLVPNIVEKSTLHSDSGTALISLTKSVDWLRTSCAKHLEPNVLPLDASLKSLAMKLLYGREISIHMAFEIRDELLSKALAPAARVSHDTKKWLTSTFSTDASMQINTQAFRNFVYTSGYSSDSAIELYFRNSKGEAETSAELRKGTIYDSLSHLFTFQSVRVSKIAKHLDNLLVQNKFMDCEPPKPDRKKSTYYRWNDQIALIPNCKLKRSIGDYHVVLEQVSVEAGSHMSEPVTRVHIVCLIGFEFKDTETNVVPSCTCPANRNVKDCCAGIMTALQSHPQFSSWFGRGWHKKELLHRRLRADCDPFIDIAKVLNKEDAQEPKQLYRDAMSRISTKQLLLPDHVENKFKQVLAKAGHDQFLLSQLHDHVCKGDDLISASLLDRQIAHKAQGKAFVSNLHHTKGGQSNKTITAKSVFKCTNLSPLCMGGAVASRVQQLHSGNSSHLNWWHLTFCIYCNYGVKNLKQHQVTKCCMEAQKNATMPRYTFCAICSAASEKCTGHQEGVPCPRSSSNVSTDL